MPIERIWENFSNLVIHVDLGFKNFSEISLCRKFGESFGILLFNFEFGVVDFYYDEWFSVVSKLLVVYIYLNAAPELLIDTLHKHIHDNLLDFVSIAWNWFWDLRRYSNLHIDISSFQISVSHIDDIVYTIFHAGALVGGSKLIFWDEINLLEIFDTVLHLFDLILTIITYWMSRGC